MPRVQISVDPGSVDIRAKANLGSLKSDDHIPTNSGAVVRDQELCLSIDMDLRRTYSYTEQEVAVPDIVIVGSHAENLVIESVLVDGEPTQMEYHPQNQIAGSEKQSSKVSSPSSAANVAGAAYVSGLGRAVA